jgi:hypothetical protein
VVTLLPTQKEKTRIIFKGSCSLLCTQFRDHLTQQSSLHYGLFLAVAFKSNANLDTSPQNLQSEHTSGPGPHKTEFPPPIMAPVKIKLLILDKTPRTTALATKAKLLQEYIGEKTPAMEVLTKEQIKAWQPVKIITGFKAISKQVVENNVCKPKAHSKSKKVVENKVSKPKTHSKSGEEFKIVRIRFCPAVEVWKYNKAGDKVKKVQVLPNRWIKVTPNDSILPGK